MLFVQATTHASDVNLEALRQLNASVTAPASSARPASLDPPREIWSSAPTAIKPKNFLQNYAPQDPHPEVPLDTAEPHVEWTAMHKRHDDTCEKLLEACRHKPVVFSLKMLAEAFSDTSTREHRIPSSKRLHSQWKQFWVQDVLAGLVLRAQAELMYEPSALDRLPEPLTAPLTEDATKLCAGMLHLNTSEVTFGALYVHFLAHVQSYVQSYQGYRVNVCELGKYLGGFFHPTLSREAVLPRSTQHANMLIFWSTDALAAYLLSSLVKLVGGEPVYPETADIHEHSPDTSASNVLGSPTNMLHSPSAAVTPGAGGPSPASEKESVIVLEPEADAESAPPFNSHWLLGSAPQALSKLASVLMTCKRKDRFKVLATVEEIAVDIRDKDDATWQFLRKFAALPADATPWDDASVPAIDADGRVNAEQEQVKAAGETSCANSCLPTCTILPLTYPWHNPDSPPDSYTCRETASVKEVRPRALCKCPLAKVAWTHDKCCHVCIADHGRVCIGACMMLYTRNGLMQVRGSSRCHLKSYMLLLHSCMLVPALNSWQTWNWPYKGTSRRPPLLPLGMEAPCCNVVQMTP